MITIDSPLTAVVGDKATKRKRMSEGLGIHTVGELVSRTEADLLDIRNFGQKSIDEVKIKLAGMGLSLKDSPAGFDPAAAALAYSDTDCNDDTDDGGVALGGEGAGIDPAAEAEVTDGALPAGAAARPAPTSSGRAADG